MPSTTEIKEARVAAGLTQAQAGALVGAPSRRTWQDWEAGRRNMPASKWELFKIKIKGEKIMFRVVSRFTDQGFLYHGTDIEAAREAARSDSEGPVSQYRTEIQQYTSPAFDEPGWYTVEYFN